MKGFQPLFLGIFGIFAFSWLGMTVVPNIQIGSLNPQMDEEGGDVYPAPPSGMALRGAQVYAANGCFYCHSQQVRPEYGGSDLERKWGERRSAPRDYIFEPRVMLGKMRTGPDLANVGHRPGQLEADGAPASSPAPGAPAAPAGGVPPVAATSPAPAAAASPEAGAAPAASPAVAAASSPIHPSATAVAPAASPTGAAASPAAPLAADAAAASPPSPATVAASSPASPPPAANGSPSPAAAGATASPGAAVAGAPANLPPAGTDPAATVPTSAPSLVQNPADLTADGQPLPYTAAWHHRHLYNPRSLSPDSNMPAYRFLYQKRRIGGKISPDALNFAGDDEDEELEEGWEIVPSYDAKCLVAYLMSRDQTHALKEAKSAVALAPAPGQEAKK